MKPTRKFPSLKLLAVSLFLLAGLSPWISRAKTENDNLFPPAPAAAGVIDFDGRGFIINGRRTFITSGSVHYARVPRENWRDILLKLKRAGFNTVETYVFWSYHEAQEGRFDFTTDSRDIGAFLDAAKEAGLYAIVRVGPYSCSEWENGGFPNWLYFKAGLEVRKDNKPFMDAMDKWFNKMLPIISARQIHKGGNVILVQLENEYPAAGWKYWGTEIDGNYFQHLLDLAHTNGLEVPMFFSGLNHGHDPAPEAPVDSANRTSPWMSTELWTVWFDRYGTDETGLLKGDRSAWRVLTMGGNGFNLYMAHGGTTFGYFNFNNDTKPGDNAEKGAACYDFGTLIGQSGDTRELYKRLKRLGYFAETFSPILANGTNSTPQFQNFATGVTVTARTSPAGTLVFLDNQAPSNAVFQKKFHVKTTPGTVTEVVLKSGSHIKLAEGEILGLAVNVSIVPGVTIAEADTRILGIVPQAGGKTLVCYGETGDTGKITFMSDASMSEKTVSNEGFKFDPQSKSLIFDFPTSGTGEEILTFGTNRLRFLVMNKATADETWFVDSAAGKQIVVGAPYLGDFMAKAPGKVSATVDYPWNDPAPTELAVYGDGDAWKIKLPSGPAKRPSETLKLAKWRMSADDAPLAKDFDDRNWFSLPDGSPPAMGADDDYSAFAWYRTQITNSVEITSLNFSRIADRATFFVDGKYAAKFDLKKDKAPGVALNLSVGIHELAVFVAHFGRAKFAGYTGPIDKLQYEKGLCAPVMANGTNGLLTMNWKLHGGVDPENPDLKWSSIKATEGVPAYFRTSLELEAQPEPGVTYRFVPDGLSSGSVWLNGHNVGRYPEIVKDCPGLWLPGCWMRKGNNTLIIYDERGNSPEKTRVKLEMSASRHRIILDLATDQ